jgi:membrane protein
VAPGQSDDEGAAGGAVGIGKQLMAEIGDDDVPGLAAEVAYHAIFSIPAMLVVFVTLAAVINNVFDYDLASRLNDAIQDSAPESTHEMLEALVTNAVEQVDGGAASIGLASAVLVALWAGSNGVGVLIKAFNRAYDATELRSFARRKGLSILLTVMLGLIVNLAFALWVFGGRIGSWLASEFRMGSTFDWAWNLSRFPVGVVVIAFTLALLYYFGPTMDQTFRAVLPGAILATALWSALVLGFSVYLFFANPGSAYGALGGVIVFLFFLYLTSLVFIVGAELNSILAHRRLARLGLLEPIADLTNARTAVVSDDRAHVTGTGVAVGVAATVGIVLAAMLGRRN